MEDVRASGGARGRADAYPLLMAFPTEVAPVRATLPELSSWTTPHSTTPRAAPHAFAAIQHVNIASTWSTSPCVPVGGAWIHFGRSALQLAIITPSQHVCEHCLRWASQCWSTARPCVERKKDHISPVDVLKTHSVVSPVVSNSSHRETPQNALN
jgi:hypothetical protein